MSGVAGTGSEINAVRCARWHRKRMRGTGDGKVYISALHRSCLCMRRLASCKMWGNWQQQGRVALRHAPRVTQTDDSSPRRPHSTSNRMHAWPLTATHVETVSEHMDCDTLGPAVLSTTCELSAWARNHRQFAASVTDIIACFGLPCSCHSPHLMQHVTLFLEVNIDGFLAFRASRMSHLISCTQLL